MAHLRRRSNGGGSGGAGNQDKHHSLFPKPPETFLDRIGEDNADDASPPPVSHC